MKKIKNLFLGIIAWCKAHKTTTVIISGCTAIAIALAIVLPLALSKKSFLVSFDLQNHGSNIEPLTVESGSKVTKPADPSEQGYSFGGWYNEAECQNIYDFENSVVTKDITLYASWSINSYTVNFEMNGHGEQINSQTVTFNEKATKPTDPSEQGCLFGGWYKESTCSTEWDFDSDVVKGDTTIYAKWNKAKTFKAVYDTTDGNNVLTLYFNNIDYSGANLTVFDNLPMNATRSNQWGYQSLTSNSKHPAKSVVIDESVENLHGLASTKGMFENFVYCKSIIGTEYLDMSNVKDASFMFYSFGFNVADLNCVPNTSSWDLSNVESIDYMFYYYGFSSKTLNKVPDVSNWNVSKLDSAKLLFYYYGSDSEVLAEVPNVSKWNTENLTSAYCMFNYYAMSSKVITKAPDVSKWNTSKLTTCSYMFQSYALNSVNLNAVPNLSNWDTSKLEKMDHLFDYYAFNSRAIEFVLDLSKWDVSNITSTSNVKDVFKSCGKYAEIWTVTIPSKTNNTDNTTDKWFTGDGTNTDLFISPATSRNFTLAK